jgi:hypothetical protein
MRKLSAKGVPKCLNEDQKINGASHLSNFGIFFGAIQIISCRDWWPWTKPGYITTTRRRSNNQWSGGIAADPSPKKFPVQKSVGKVLASIFGIKTASSSLIILQGAKLSTRSITHLCWCNWRTFRRKKTREFHQRGLVLARQCPGSPGTCNPKESGLPGLPMSWSPTYFPDLAPSEYHLCSGPKNNWKFAIFHPTRRSMLPRRPG